LPNEQTSDRDQTFSFAGRNRRIHLNFHTPYWVRSVGDTFDGEEVIETLTRAGVNEVTAVFGLCSCGNAYWDTRRDDLRHPGLAKDMVDELLRGARGSGVHVSIHFAVGCNNRLIERKPEWAMARRDGSLLDGGPSKTWAWPCLNSPHLDENVLPLLEEFLERYRPDGLFLDMVTFAEETCFCSWCLERMREEDVDPDDPLGSEEFRARTIDRVIERASTVVRARAPGIALTVNNQTRFGRLLRRRDQLDFVDVEALMSWGALGYPMRVRYARSGGLPIAGMTTRFLKDWDYFGTLTPLAQMKSECASFLSTANAVCIGDHPQPSGRLDPFVYERIGHALSYVRERERWSIGARAINDVAVLVDPDSVTDRTASSAFRRGPAEADDMRGSKARATFGAGKALLEGQRDFNVVDIDAEWTAHRCVIAAENQRIGQPEAERLSGYVAGGGRLLLIGPQIWTDEDARPLIEDIAGVRWAGPGAFSSCFIGEPGGWSAHYVSGPFARLIPRPGCEAIAPLLLPLEDLDSPPVFSGHHAPPGDPDEGVGITRCGNVVTIAASLASDYWQSGNPDLRRLLVDALDLVLPEPYVEIEPHSPLIEISIMELGGEHIVHVLQQTVNRGTGPVLVEDVPVRRDVTVTVRAPYPVREVVRLPSEEPLPGVAVSGGVRVELPELGFHEMLKVVRGTDSGESL
jgi:hypothetical protein